MIQYSISFNPDRDMPFQKETDGYYNLTLGGIYESATTTMIPLPYNSILERVRVVFRGKFPFSSAGYAYLRANIVKNGDILRAGECTFKPKDEAAVVTRHVTKEPKVKCKAGDCIGIQLHNHDLVHGTNQLYVSAVMNFKTF